MKLGLNIFNGKKPLDSTDNPLGQEEGDSLIELPNVGDSLGPGGGLIYKQDPETTTEISYWESNIAIIDNCSFTIATYFIVNNSIPTWETLINALDFTAIPFGTETIDATYFENNENEEYFYTDNDNLFDILTVNSANENAFLGDLENTINGWLFYFLNTVTSQSNVPITLFYKFKTEELQIIIKTITVELDGTITTAQNNLTSSVPTIHFFIGPTPSEKKLIPILSRQFTIENPNPSSSFIEPVPAALNVFPQETISYIDANFAANYNGITSQNIASLIDRYRPIENIKDAEAGWQSADKNFVTATARNSAENSKLVSFSTANRQIIVKIIYLNPSKPPAPWYDRATGEILTLECKIACFGNNYSGATYAKGISNYQTIYVQETANSQLNLSGSTQFQGQTVYYSERRFVIDVSNILFTNYLGEGASEVVTVESKSYTGAAGTYKAMLFELFDLKISSNKRAGKTPNIPYSQTGLISVPTFKAPAYPVGYDFTGIFEALDDNFINNSLKPGVEKMDTSLLDYDFNMYNPQSYTGTSFTEHPCYNQFAVFPFENKEGALNTNYTLVNLSTNNVTIQVSVNINYIQVFYQDIVATIRKVITDANGVETATNLTSTTILRSDVGSLLHTHTQIIQPNESLRYEIKFVGSGQLQTNIFIVKGGISAIPWPQTGQILEINTKLRPRFNYF